MDKKNLPAAKGPAARAPAPKSTTPPPTPAHPPPLFRGIDWLTFAISTLAVWIGYYLTLAPDLTLEDSGELAVGSYYAGIPHPPGYPVWTIYTWFWANLLPFKNIAWRVALGEATGGALACGLLGFLVSRGSSMMMEGIAALKNIERRWENAICVVAGSVAGMLLGFNGYMWSQSVIVEVYSFSVLSLMGVLLCLLRWIYAPHQRRYLYWAFFLFGICFTNHQTLICAAMGLEVAVLATDRKLGRNMFFMNSVVYLIGLIMKLSGSLTSFDNNQALFMIYHVVGIGSLYTFLWNSLSNPRLTRLYLILGHLLINVLIIAVWLKGKAKPNPPFTDVQFTKFMIFVNPVGIWLIYLFCLISGTAEKILIFKRDCLLKEWLPVKVMGLLWVFGAAFYLFMAVSGMTNPPMQWGYPRTVEGFVHALTRGQYEKTNPTDLFNDPLRFVGQLQMFFEGVHDEFNWVCALLALVPFLFYRRMQKRERAWVMGITAIYLCLGILLLILLNPPPDRQARELIRVFFTASHVMVAMGVGYGLTLIAASLATHYQSARRAALLGGLVAADIAVFALAAGTHSLLGAGAVHEAGSMLSFLKFVFVVLTSTCVVLIAFRIFFNPSGAGQDTHEMAALGSIGLVCLVICANTFISGTAGIEQSTLVGFAKVLCWLLAAICLYFAWRPRQQDDRVIMGVIASLLALLSVGLTAVAILGDQPRFSGLKIFVAALQKAFRPDQYALPVTAALMLVALTVVFVASIWFYRQRAPLLISLGLFACLPLHSVLTHWADNEQRNHLFGYWFGHDMFTPPFVGSDGKFSYDPKLRAEMMKDPAKAKLTYPEMTRDAILYGGTDPGRFCPTYMIFCESFIPAKCKPLDPNFDRRDVYIITQNALADGTYLMYIRAHYNRSEQLKYDTPFFQELLRSTKERENYKTNLLARVAGSLLDRPFGTLGANIEASRRKQGVYPPKEMYIATPDDSQRCFQEYLTDAQRRLQAGRLRPGEDVRIIENRVQVSGQIAVMAINGLLTKVMFDHNTTNEFFVEESFPLDWMYPHLTPFGIIMKINRQPLPTLTQEILDRDHAFWSKYSERLVGNWITYDTPVKEITDFAEKVYLRRDFNGFKGDRKFARDDQAQKAFSKLRSSIGGIYAWRLNPDPLTCPPEYRPKTAEEYERIRKEVDFTFRQALAFCPYSPEAVFRYVQFLAQFNRMDEALLVAETCLKLDPYNGQVIGLVKNLRDSRDRVAEMNKMRGDFQRKEDEVRKNPTDFQAAFNLAAAYMNIQQTQQALVVLDNVLNSPNVNREAALFIADIYVKLNNWAKLEATLDRLVHIIPNEPEAWYDLAALKCSLGKTAEGIQNLTRALELSAKRLAANPKERDLLAESRKDARFNALRHLPEFQKLVAPP